MTPLISVRGGLIPLYLDQPTNFTTSVVDLSIYPTNAFYLAMSIGLLILRRRRAHLGLPRADFSAWTSVVIFNCLANVYLLVMPWYPPSSGADGGDVTFWYATYCVTGIAM